MITTWEKLLTTYAYNILGSYEDAKDVVQAIKEEMHKWYAHDKTITTQKEILELLKKTCLNQQS